MEKRQYALKLIVIRRATHQMWIQISIFTASSIRERTRVNIFPCRFGDTKCSGTWANSNGNLHLALNLDSIRGHRTKMKLPSDTDKFYNKLNT